MQVWLQEFAWLEEEAETSLQTRNGRGSNRHFEALKAEPIFCMQTATTALYWALLAYHVQEVRPLSKADLV